jgi:alpha-glucosidase
MDVQETEEAIEIKTDQVLIRIERNPCRLICLDQAGRPFAEDAETGIGWSGNTVAGWKKMEADEHFYGFGERTGLLDKRSERKTNWTLDALDYTTVADEMYQAIPFFMALRPQVGYGIFFNTTFWSQFDMGAVNVACGRWKPTAANWTTTLSMVLPLPKFSKPTRS